MMASPLNWNFGAEDSRLWVHPRQVIPTSMIENASTPSISTRHPESIKLTTRDSFRVLNRWGINGGLIGLVYDDDACREFNGPIGGLTLSATAFGFGPFTLVFSLLPFKVKGVVEFFGFHHDRKLALRPLAVVCCEGRPFCLF